MPDSTLLLGTNNGHAGTGLPGFQDAMPFEPNNYIMRRYVETFMATMQGQALGSKPSWNDVLNTYRMLHTRDGMGPVPPNMIAGLGSGGIMPRANPQTGTGNFAAGKIDPVSGALVTSAGIQHHKGVTDQTAVGIATVVAQNDNVAIVASVLGDQSSSQYTGPLVYTRRTDASNWIRASRQAAGVLRIEKNIATVITTEVDLTVDVNEPVSGSSIGLRINGTRMRVVYNGVMVGDFTLSAGAQGLAGTLAGVEIADTSRQAIDAFTVWRVT